MNSVFGSEGVCGSSFWISSAAVLAGAGTVLITWNADDEAVNDLRPASRAGSKDLSREIRVFILRPDVARRREFRQKIIHLLDGVIGIWILIVLRREIAGQARQRGGVRR